MERDFDMCQIRQSVIYAGMMVVLSLLAREGLADRDAVMVLLLVLPVLIVTSIFRNRSARCA